MQFDNMTKEKLLAMDNKSLAELIGRISTAIGADQRKTGALLSDLDGDEGNDAILILILALLFL